MGDGKGNYRKALRLLFRQIVFCIRIHTTPPRNIGFNPIYPKMTGSGMKLLNFEPSTKSGPPSQSCKALYNGRFPHNLFSYARFRTFPCRPPISRDHYKPEANLVMHRITKLQHQVIRWLILTHEKCPAPGL